MKNYKTTNLENLNLQNVSKQELEIKLEELYKIQEYIARYIDKVESKIYLPF